VIEMPERLSAGAGVRRRLDAGEMLFASGDPVRSLFVMWSGWSRNRPQGGLDSSSAGEPSGPDAKKHPTRE